MYKFWKPTPSLIISFDEQWTRIINRREFSWFTFWQLTYQKSLTGLQELWIAFMGLRIHVQYWKKHDH